MHRRQLLAILLDLGGVLLLSARVGSHLLLLLLHLGRQVSKGGIAVERTLGLGARSTPSLHHQPTNLLLKRVILFFELVVFFLDSEVVLDLLGLIVVADVHLLAPHAFELFFEPLLLICKGL